MTGSTNSDFNNATSATLRDDSPLFMQALLAVVMNQNPPEASKESELDRFEDTALGFGVVNMIASSSQVQLGKHLFIEANILGIVFVDKNRSRNSQIPPATTMNHNKKILLSTQSCW